MATPVVDVSFTADVQCGVSPFTVTFTNTTQITDGFAREFLWTFGDGSVSEDENPTHEYSGDPGESFDVSLAVLATEGEFDGLNSSTNFGPTNFISSLKTTGSGPTNNDAWEARSVDTPTDHFFGHQVSFNGVTYFYNTNDVGLYLKSNSSSLAFVQIRARIVADIQDIQGMMQIDGGGDTPTVVNVWTVVGRLTGVTTANPKASTAIIIPQVQLGSPPAGHNWGIKAEAGTRTFPPTATQEYGEDTEIDFIQIATEPVASFVAVPSVGNSPLSVKFNNTTVLPSCGPEPTWSWKKRIYGSGDSFVEFSTQKNPTHIFTK